MTAKKIIVGITGASGSIYAKNLLKKLQQIEDIEEVAVVFSENGKKVWQYELKEYSDLQNVSVYANNDMFAPVASGSARYTDMVIIPCSMGTMAKVANGIADDLIVRAADVMLKERRKLVIVPREMPYNLIHIENLKKITLAGGIICPASPSFYSFPESIDEVVNTVVDRVIDLLGIESDSYRWGKDN